MKRFSLFLVGLYASVYLLTSCLKGSNVWEGYVVGVLEYSDKNFFQPVLKTSMGDYYSPSFNNLMSEGQMSMFGCYHVYLQVDSDTPENAPSIVELNGYQTVTVHAFQEVPRYSLNYVLTDTSTVLTSEAPLLKGYDAGDYVARHFFAVHQMNIQDDSELSWNLSFDNNRMYTEEGGKRYYDLFVRAIVTKEGGKSKTNKSFMIAYAVGGYMTLAAEQEKALLGSTYNASTSKFALRFNFVSDINETTKAMTWGSDQIDAPVAPFLYENQNPY